MEREMETRANLKPECMDDSLVVPDLSGVRLELTSVELAQGGDSGVDATSLICTGRGGGGAPFWQWGLSLLGGPGSRGALWRGSALFWRGIRGLVTFRL